MIQVVFMRFVRIGVVRVSDSVLLKPKPFVTLACRAGAFLPRRSSSEGGGVRWFPFVRKDRSVLEQFVVAQKARNEKLSLRPEPETKVLWCPLEVNL